MDARPQGACLQAFGLGFFSLRSKFPCGFGAKKNDRGMGISVLVGRKMEQERGLFLSFIYRAAKTENPVPGLRKRTETFATQALTSSFHFILILDL